MSNYARWVLFAADVAAIFTEERRKAEGRDAPPVTADRVHDLTRWSKPTPPGTKHRNRYEDHPIPYPREAPYPRMAVWAGDQEQDLRDWWHDRMDAQRENHWWHEPTDGQRENREQAAQRRLTEWHTDAADVAGTNRRRRRNPL